MKSIKRKKLHNRAVALFVLMAIIVNVIVIGGATYVYTRDTRASYSRICTGIAQVIASSVYASSVEDMLENEAKEQYAFLKKQVLDTVSSTPELEHVYIYNMQREGMYLLVDTANEDTPVGTRLDYPDELAKYIDDFDNSKRLTGIMRSSAEHSTVTSLIPIFDVRGRCVCYVGCDMNMDSAYSSIRDFTTRLTLIVTVPTMLFAVVTAIFLQKRVFSPINKLDSYLKIYEKD